MKGVDEDQRHSSKDRIIWINGEGGCGSNFDIGTWWQFGLRKIPNSVIFRGSSSAELCRN